MTVSSAVNRNDYAGNGSTTSFAVSFRFLENSHIKATLRDALSTETLQVETTDYTLTGAGGAGGGTLVMIVAPPTGTTLTIQRDVPATQETDYVENDEFPAESHEDALDKLTMLVQQQGEDSTRHIGFSDTVSDATGSAVELSQDATQRADKFLGFDSAGNIVTKTASDSSLLDQDQQDKRLGPIFATLTAAKAGNPVSVGGGIVNLVAGMTVYVQGSAAAGDKGQSQYLIAASQTVDNFKDHDAANGTVLLYQEPSADLLDIEHVGGVTAAALNAAVDSLDTGNDIYTGGQMRFGTGQHSMDDTIVLDNVGVSRLAGLTLSGEGKQGSSLGFTAAGAGKIGVDMIQPVFNTIKDLNIRDASLSGVRLKSSTHDGALGSWNHVSAQRSRFSFNGLHGIEAGRGFLGHFDQVFCSHNDQNGFDITDLHTSLLFSNCYGASNSNGSGYRLDHLTYSCLNACAADTNGQYGYSITKSNSTVLNGCGNESNSRSGYNFESSTAQGANQTVTLQSCFAFNNNTSNGGWANFARLIAADGVENKVVAKGCIALAPANAVKDVIVSGEGSYFVDEDNTFPSGVQSVSRGYIHHVNRTKVVRDLSVTAATTVTALANPQGHDTQFGGCITVIASNQDPATASARNMATYHLMVDKGVLGSQIVQIAALGVLSGAGASFPSFTWTLVGSNLTATPIASTSGVFFFEILCQGPAVKPA